MKKQLIRGDMPDLAVDEWDFVPQNMTAYSEQQLNLWLNYEYARSSRLIVEAVMKRRRHGASTGPLPRFALFLYNYFPDDFPEKPFHCLTPASQAVERWQTIAGVSPQCFDTDIIRLYDIFDVTNMVHEGQLTFSPNNPADERFALMEINWGYPLGGRFISVTEARAPQEPKGLMREGFELGRTGAFRLGTQKPKGRRRSGGGAWQGRQGRGRRN